MTTNQDWWPDKLDLSPLRAHNARRPVRSHRKFDYAKAFNSLDLAAVKLTSRL